MRKTGERERGRQGGKEVVDIDRERGRLRQEKEKKGGSKHRRSEMRKNREVGNGK